MNIVVFGAGPHSKVVIDVLREMDEYQTVGIIDSERSIDSIFYGYKVIGRQTELIRLSEEYKFNAGIVAVGDNYSREKIAQDIIAQCKNFIFINAISRFTHISPSATMGIGNVIMNGVIINADAVVSNHCLLNTQSILEHDSMMENFTSLSVGVKTGGFCKFSKYSAISIGAIIQDRITVGENVVVGSGALVTKNLESHGLYYGVPAKRIRDRKPAERFLK